MLHVVVLKKDTLQIVEYHLDGPVGGIPQSSIIASSGSDDLDLNHSLIKIGEGASVGPPLLWPHGSSLSNVPRLPRSVSS